MEWPWWEKLAPIIAGRHDRNPTAEDAQIGLFGEHCKALHQRVGGAAVIEGQLRVLAGFAADSGLVTVQVLPFDRGAHGAAGVGSLSMLQFAEAPGLGLVHLGGVGGGVCLEAQEDIAACARVFEQVKAFALTPAQSALLLRGLADR